MPCGKSLTPVKIICIMSVASLVCGSRTTVGDVMYSRTAFGISAFALSMRSASGIDLSPTLRCVSLNCSRYCGAPAWIGLESLRSVVSSCSSSSESV